MKFVFLVILLVISTGCGKVSFSPASHQTDGPSNNSNNNPPGINPPPVGGPAPSCTLTSSNTTIITSLPAGVTPAMVASICPSIGQDSECGVVIFVSDSGVSLYFTGQGPFDGADDTLVGLFNMSSFSLNGIALSSNLNIMTFDADGIDTYKINGTNNMVGGNAMDNTTYGGPNTYFTSVTNGGKSGTVGFIKPVAARGGSTFFSLEQALNAASACLSTQPQ